MLTGYNTDVSYGGEVFHVQTEDKGIHSPIILSLVYRAGTILAAKRTPYTNLIQDGIVDELAVAQILNKQHQILVAAIKAGKSDKLAALSRQQSGQQNGQQGGAKSPGSKATRAVPGAPASSPAKGTRERQSQEFKPAPNPPIKVEVAAPPTAPRGESKSVEALTFDQIIAGYLQNTNAAEQLRIEVLYPSRFRAGEEVTVRAAVLSGGTTPTQGTTVKLQILGTKIEAQTWTGRTDFQGLVSFQVKIPIFTSGAAALILKAQSPTGQEAETKFMIAHK
jgi:hypothetical protein